MSRYPSDHPPWRGPNWNVRPVVAVPPRQPAPVRPVGVPPPQNLQPFALFIPIRSMVNPGFAPPVSRPAQPMAARRQLTSTPTADQRPTNSSASQGLEKSTRQIQILLDFRHRIEPAR